MMTMAKYRLNQILLFVLITAFLAMQSASAHIHLAEHHDHDGSHHQHHSEAHAHQSIGSHADAIDFSHQIDHANAIELAHECHIGKGTKQETSFAVLVAPAFRQPAIFEYIGIKLPALVNTRLSHLYRSTVNLRAHLNSLSLQTLIKFNPA